MTIDAHPPARPPPRRRMLRAAAIWNDLLALLWPCACLVCGAPDRDVCSRCTAALRAAAAGVRRVRAPAGVDTWVFGAYQGAPKALLLACKHGGSTRLAPLLGELLSSPLRSALHEALHEALRELPQPHRARLPVLIVTAPSRAARVRERGFRHVDLMLRHALRHAAHQQPENGDPRPRLLPGALLALPGRTGQVGLRAEQRRRNARMLRVPRRMVGRLRDREVVLVDDIVTTGATLEAAAAALAAAGARVIATVALCAAERRDRPLEGPARDATARHPGCGSGYVQHDGP